MPILLSINMAAHQNSTIKSQKRWLFSKRLEHPPSSASGISSLRHRWNRTISVKIVLKRLKGYFVGTGKRRIQVDVIGMLWTCTCFSGLSTVIRHVIRRFSISNHIFCGKKVLNIGSEKTVLNLLFLKVISVARRLSRWQSQTRFGAAFCQIYLFHLL